MISHNAFFTLVVILACQNTRTPVVAKKVDGRTLHALKRRGLIFVTDMDGFAKATARGKVYKRTDG